MSRIPSRTPPKPPPKKQSEPRSERQSEPRSELQSEPQSKLGTADASAYLVKEEPNFKGAERSGENTTKSLPKANEGIIKNTKLFQAQPKVETRFETLASTQEDSEAGQNPDPSDPWQGLAVQKVALNRYIRLGYISEDSLKNLVERFHKIQTRRQQKFRHIIREMQQDEENAAAYSSLITETEREYSYTILFLDFSRYIKSLFHRPTRRILQTAHLVYPQGALMQWAFEKLSGPKVEKAKAEKADAQKNEQKLQTKFGFTVSLLSALDEYHCSVFLVGGTSAALNRVENNFKLSFGDIQVLGRHAQKYRRAKNIEHIRTLINKSAPVLLLLASAANIHDFIDEKRSEQKMKPFLILDYPEALQDFSGKYRDKNQSVSHFVLGLGYLIFPWKWPKLLCILIFWLKICFASLVHKK